VKKLVALGATPEEIKAIIVDTARQAEEEAKIGLSRRASLKRRTNGA